MSAPYWTQATLYRISEKVLVRRVGHQPLSGLSRKVSLPSSRLEEQTSLRSHIGSDDEEDRSSKLIEDSRFLPQKFHSMCMQDMAQVEAVDHACFTVLCRDDPKLIEGSNGSIVCLPSCLHMSLPVHCISAGQ